MILLPLLCLLYMVKATSVPVATSPIVTLITSTYYSTSSSSIGSTTSYSNNGEACATSTNSAGILTSSCVELGASVVTVPVYTTAVITLTTYLTSTEGYTTIYSDMSDEATITSSDLSPASTTLPCASTATGGVFSFGGRVRRDTECSSSSSGPAASTLSTREVSLSRTITSTNIVTTSNTSIRITSTTASIRPSDPSKANNSSSSNTLKIAIAIAIILAILLVGCVILIVFFIRRRRARQRGTESKVQPASTEKPELEAPSSSNGQINNIGISLTSATHNNAGGDMSARVQAHELQAITAYEVHAGTTAHRPGIAHHAHYHLHEAAGQARSETSGNPLHEAQGVALYEAGGMSRYEMPLNMSIATHTYKKLPE